MRLFQNKLLDDQADGAQWLIATQGVDAKRIHGVFEALALEPVRAPRAERAPRELPPRRTPTRKNPAAVVVEAAAADPRADRARSSTMTSPSEDRSLLI